MDEEQIDEKIMVRAYHTQALRYCKKGAKKYMESHGFDWDTFVKVGYTTEEIIAACGSDTLALRAIEYAKKEAENGGRR